MSSSKTFLQSVSSTLLIAAILVSGCAKPTPEKEEASTENDRTPQIELAGHENAPLSQTHELVGVWWGKGSLDNDALTGAMDGLSEETKLQVNIAATTFLETEMAVEFRADGKMETAIEVLGKSGQRESGMSVADWEAFPTIRDGEYSVTSVEVQADGSEIADHKTYRISADGQTLTLLVDLPGLLGQCGPTIVLKRQSQNEKVASNEQNQIR